VQETISRIEGKVFASDKFLGTLAATWDKANACFEKGYQWMVVMQDGATLVGASRQAVSRFRDSYGDG
jgi:2-keto-3-deoxy-L-rhamnonate aldolase RhmA